MKPHRLVLVTTPDEAIELKDQRHGKLKLRGKQRACVVNQRVSSPNAKFGFPSDFVGSLSRALMTCRGFSASVYV